MADDRQTSRYWWDDMSPAERAEFFCYFTPEQGLAALAEISRRHGIPDKITDPEIVERVARILTPASGGRRCA
jgi:hypothetical protein